MSGMIVIHKFYCYITRAHLTAPTTIELTFYSRAKQKSSMCSSGEPRALRAIYECSTSCTSALEVK